MLRLAILISGRGSNMKSILEAIKTGYLTGVEAEIVISNNEKAQGLSIAREYGIETEVLNHHELEGWAFDEKLVACLRRHDISSSNGLICLAGYMRILSPELVARYKMSIINIHPSLLPSFPGLHAQKQALEYGVKVTGCTVHFVDENVDSGLILLQQPVWVSDSDSEESLSEKILKEEHKLYPRAIKILAEKRITIHDRKITVE